MNRRGFFHILASTVAGLAGLCKGVPAEGALKKPDQDYVEYVDWLPVGPDAPYVLLTKPLVAVGPIEFAGQAQAGLCMLSDQQADPLVWVGTWDRGEWVPLSAVSTSLVDPNFVSAAKGWDNG